jgi:hypothetical protein
MKFCAKRSKLLAYFKEKTMENKKFMELLKKTNLPFLFSGERLNDETCKKVLKKMGAESGVLALVMSDAIVGKAGIAITETGIVFSGTGGAVNDKPRTKGSFPFNQFLVHNVEVKAASLLPKFIITLTLYDNVKQKGLSFEYHLTWENLQKDDATITGLTNLFKCLVTKTGTEYVSPAETASGNNKAESAKPAIKKNSNEYDFEYGDVHTIITVNDDNIVIKRLKIDEKTKIQAPKGPSVTISRAAIGSIKMGRTFSHLPLAGCVAAGILVGFLIFGGILTVLASAVIGFVLSFPKAMVIRRKDNTTYKTILSGDEENVKEYERFINVIFK